MKNIKILVFASLLFSSCKKDEVQTNLSPLTKIVLLDKNGNEVITRTSATLRLTTTTSTGQNVDLHSNCGEGCGTFIQEYVPSTTQPYKFVCFCLGLTNYSMNAPQRWYLTLNGKTDTLDYELKSASVDVYADMHVERAVFNGRPVQTNAQLDSQFGYPTFVLRRRH